MAISDHVRSQLFREAELIRIPVTRRSAAGAAPCKPRAASPAAATPRSGRHGVWTKREHALFLEALDMFPAGPWKAIAEHVGSKTARQAMTHGQKYRQKIARRQRGLKKHVRDLGDDADDDLDAVSDADQLMDREAPLPVAFSDAEFAAFIANLDVQVAPVDDVSDSPLFVPDTPADVSHDAFELDDGFSLDAPVLNTVAYTSAPADLDHELPCEQEMQHLAAMMRADVTSDALLSPMLLAALHRGSASVPTFDVNDMEEMAPFLPSLPPNNEWEDAELEQEMMLALMNPMQDQEHEPLDAPFML